MTHPNRLAARLRAFGYWRPEVALGSTPGGFFLSWVYRYVPGRGGLGLGSQRQAETDEHAA